MADTATDESPDLELTCADCGIHFLLIAGERQWFSDRGLHLPRRCKSCRAARREALERQQND
jgi:hypothetical protein